MVAVLLPDLGLPIGLAKQPMKEVVGDAGETSAPSRSASGLISVHCALYSVQCKRTVYSVQCTVYSVQCTGVPLPFYPRRCLASNILNRHFIEV